MQSNLVGLDNPTFVCMTLHVIFSRFWLVVPLNVKKERTTLFYSHVLRADNFDSHAIFRRTEFDSACSAWAFIPHMLLKKSEEKLHLLTYLQYQGPTELTNEKPEVENLVTLSHMSD